MPADAVVIGAGFSGIQVIPVIAQRAAQVTVFATSASGRDRHRGRAEG